MSNAVTITPKKRSLIFMNLIITCVASSMLATALTTALPSMVKEFDISLTTGQWMTSGYSLAMGIMMPLTAFLINRFPTKRLYLTAIICFLLGLILCVIAPNFTVLMCGRILQASGNGILTSMTQVILLTIYPPEQRGSVMGWYGLSIGAAPVIAPALAGMIVDTYGWRMIFYVAIAIIVLSLICACIVFENVLDTAKKKFDVLSFILSGLAFAGITLGIGNINSFPFVSVQVLSFLALGLGTAAIFVYRQLHQEEPFLELRILAEREYALSVIGSMILYLIMMGASILLPIYVQTVMGQTATVSGFVSLPGSLAMTIISPFAGKIYDKIGMKVLFVAGAFCMLASNVAMTFLTMETPIWLPAVYNVLRCIAIGCLMMPLVTWGTGSLDKSKTAHATALLTSLRTVSGALGSAIFVGIMTSVATRSVADYGSNADMHGLNITFLVMAVVNVSLILIALFGVKSHKKVQSEEAEEKENSENKE